MIANVYYFCKTYKILFQKCYNIEQRKSDFIIFCHFMHSFLAFNLLILHRSSICISGRGSRPKQSQ